MSLYDNTLDFTLGILKTSKVNNMLNGFIEREDD